MPMPGLRCPTPRATECADQIAGEAQQAFLHFDSLKRMLDRDEPGWQKLA